MFCPCLGHRRWFSYINRLLFIFYKKISPIITNAPPNDHHRQTSRKAPNRTFSDDKSLGPSGPSQTKVFARKTDEGWILNYRPMTSSSSRWPLCVGIGRIGRRGRKYRNGKCIRALWDAKGYVYEEVLLVKWFVLVFFFKCFELNVMSQKIFECIIKSWEGSRKFWSSQNILCNMT